MSSAKVFGSIIAGVTYQPRPAAYAVIRNVDGKVASVQGRSGRYFLPGGGALPNEAPEETVRREAREELGRELWLVRESGRAVQYFYAEGQYYRMEAVFFAAEFVGEPMEMGEYQLEWLDADEFAAGCFHLCHAWAVGRS